MSSLSAIEMLEPVSVIWLILYRITDSSSKSESV
jgi:hypothetical protein